MSAGEKIQLLCFQLGPRVFAVDIMGVREILRNQRLTPVPQTPDHIAGVVNLRGELIPVVNLRRIFLNGAEEGTGDDPKLVVAHVRGKTAALQVDQVLDVVSVPAESLTPLPGEASGAGPMVMAAFRKGGPTDEVVVLLRLAPLVGEQGDFAREEIRQP